jgi:hypothetical protein
VVSVRMVQILRRKLAAAPLWDGLALGGVACFAGYLILGMESAYFLAPVDLIAILYLGRLAFLSLGNKGFGVRLCAAVLVAVVLVQDLSLSAFRMYERKNVIHAKAEMAQAIEARYQSDPRHAPRLFFPFATPFHIMEFASYLNYIGVPVEGARSAAATNLELVGTAIPKDGPCGYRTFLCHPGSQPDPGDLVVVFPDDLMSSQDLERYEEVDASLLFSYHPRPSIPSWLRPFVNHLHAISPIFSQSPLPDSWLNGSLTIWK